MLGQGMCLRYLISWKRFLATSNLYKTWIVWFEYMFFQLCLQVQKLLGICSQHLEKGETHQGPAVLGIALIAMAEELGAEMAVRSLERLLQYGEQNIRRAVPLALGILCISNPKVCV